MGRVLSPTAISLWQESRSEFYLRYKCGVRGVQNEHMVIGLGFDQLAKRRIVGVGEGGEGGVVDGVVDGLQDLAKRGGAECLERYEEEGGFRLFERAESIRCESVEKGQVVVDGVVVELTGKPDCVFTIGGVGVVLDWKVNGYLTGGGRVGRGGVVGQVGEWSVIEGFEGVDVGWARQLLIYGIMCGVDVWEGGGGLGVIHQLCWRKAPAWMGVEKYMTLVEYVGWVGGEFVAAEKKLWKEITERTGEGGDWGLDGKERNRLDKWAEGWGKEVHGDYLREMVSWGR